MEMSSSIEPAFSAISLAINFEILLHKHVLMKVIDVIYPNYLIEWGSTARNSIARQPFARHFWQEINCSTQNLSTARIQ